MKFFFLILLCLFAPSARCETRSDFKSLLARGRVMLDNDDARAYDTLQRAVELSSGAAPAQQTQAVLAWSRAAARWKSRDDAVEIMARGLAQNDTPELRDALAPLLANGLPGFATEATLQTLSNLARSQWTMQRFTFTLPSGIASREYSKEVARDFLVTSGTLFITGKNADGAPQLWQTPPLYSAYSNLPPTLKMNRVVYGFVRNGNSRYSQVVRVLYADVDANERTRAERTCRDLLRVWCSFENALSRRNLYGDLTTIWLSRESALWPQAENTTAWNAGAQLDSAPADIVLFRTAEARPPAEWLREVAHEYSHLTLPPFAGYAPPIEPFGNGVQGESLLMLWALSSPQSYFATEEVDEARRNLRVHVTRHSLPAWKSWTSRNPRTPIVGNDENARRLLQGLTLRIERVYGAQTLKNALSQLDSESVETQRQAALAMAQRRNLAGTGSSSDNVLRADALRIAAARVLDARFKTSPKESWWIAGALSPSRLSPDELASRAPLVLKKNERASGWIYVPQSAKQLRIENSANNVITPIVANGWKLVPSKVATVFLSSSKIGWQRFEIRAMEDCVLSRATWE